MNAFGRVAVRYVSYKNKFLLVQVGGWGLCYMKIRLTLSSSTKAGIGLSLALVVAKYKNPYVMITILLDCWRFLQNMKDLLYPLDCCFAIVKQFLSYS